MRGQGHGASRKPIGRGFLSDLSVVQYHISDRVKYKSCFLSGAVMKLKSTFGSANITMHDLTVSVD